MIRDGEIKDATTVAALGLLHTERLALDPPDPLIREKSHITQPIMPLKSGRYSSRAKSNLPIARQTGQQFGRPVIIGRNV